MTLTIRGVYSLLETSAFQWSGRSSIKSLSKLPFRTRFVPLPTPVQGPWGLSTSQSASCRIVSSQSASRVVISNSLVAAGSLKMALISVIRLANMDSMGCSGVTNTIELEERVRIAFSFGGNTSKVVTEVPFSSGKPIFLVIEQSPLYSPVRLIFWEILLRLICKSVNHSGIFSMVTLNIPTFRLRSKTALLSPSWATVKSLCPSRWSPVSVLPDFRNISPGGRLSVYSQFSVSSAFVTQ